MSSSSGNVAGSTISTSSPCAIGAPAAVLNAINDALTPFGVSINEIPATPQRIRAALRQAGKIPA